MTEKKWWNYSNFQDGLPFIAGKRSPNRSVPMSVNMIGSGCESETSGEVKVTEVFSSSGPTRSGCSFPAIRCLFCPPRGSDTCTGYLIPKHYIPGRSLLEARPSAVRQGALAKPPPGRSFNSVEFKNSKHEDFIQVLLALVRPSSRRPCFQLRTSSH